MRKNYWLVFALVLIVPAMMFTVSCAKKAVEAEPTVSETPTETEQPAMETPAETQPEQGMSEDALAEQQAAMEKQREREMFMNEDLYFDFDSSALLPAAQQVLNAKANYLLDNPNALVTIEGNCDERGTEAYNIALGQRRADAAKDYLINLGIDPVRIDTISYGEERPVDPAHNEEAWAKNRRDHFVLR
ncbi:MAG: peptidoglycan-associated lipoprotein Pal [Desulfosarcinaceae bacterium]